MNIGKFFANVVVFFFENMFLMFCNSVVNRCYLYILIFYKGIKKMTLALVTGSSRGIGRAIAVELANSGIDVVVTYNSDQQAAERVVEDVKKLGVTAQLLKLDISNGQETEQIITEMIKERGCPDILVNNAGITRDGLFAMMSSDSWQAVIDTNLSGFYSVTRPIVRQMIRKRAGRIINLT